MICSLHGGIHSFPERRPGTDLPSVRRASPFTVRFGNQVRLPAGVSDLDFLVEFRPMPPREHARSYFGLIKELEQLFMRKVDLVEASAVRNPYIRHNIEATQVAVYAA
jgi:predicted nucleotidyltransferase